MRDIKFRGKRTDNGAWVYGHFVKLPRDAGGFQEPPSLEQDYWISNQGVLDKRLEEVEPETVGQYVGVKDVNGKEYFENDICESRYINPLTGQEVVERYTVVTQENTMIKLMHASGEQRWDRYLYMQYDKLEIVGNIYDNANLLDLAACRHQSD